MACHTPTFPSLEKASDFQELAQKEQKSKRTEIMFLKTK